METFKIIRSKRKTLALQIKNGELIVRAPLFIFRSTIDRFIEKHESWIQKKLQTCKKRRIFSEEEKKSLKIKAKKYIPNRVKELASEH
jgi:predicted metal-dependent hydrolase